MATLTDRQPDLENDIHYQRFIQTLIDAGLHIVKARREKAEQQAQQTDQTNPNAA